MALAVSKTYVAAEVLFASDLNLSLTTIHNNALALISPLTGNLDVDGFDLLDTGEYEFRDESADPTADGRMRRSGDEVTLRMQDARTATVARPWALWADTTGAPAANIGIGMLFQAESADENPSDFGALDFAASDIGAGTEDTYLDVLVRIAGAALAAIYRFQATGAFRGIFTHANTADRTYTLPNIGGGVLISTATAEFLQHTRTGATIGAYGAGATFDALTWGAVTFAVAFSATPTTVISVLSTNSIAAGSALTLNNTTGFTAYTVGVANQNPAGEEILWHAIGAV